MFSLKVTELLYCSQNPTNPFSEPGHQVKAQRSCVARARFYRVSVGTRWRPRGFCPMPIVSSMQITTILQFIVHNVLSMHNPPMLIVPSMHNTQCAIKAQCHQSGWQKLAAFRRGQKGHKKNSGAYLLFL